MTTRAQLAHQKEQFLDHFRRGGNVKAACEAAGIGRRTAYGWREHDRVFGAAYLDAELEAIDHLEQEAWNRAMGRQVTKSKFEPQRLRGKLKLDADGKPIMIETERVLTKEYSDNLLMFLLKARAPEKYRERYDFEHSGKGGGKIPLALIDEWVAKADGKEAVA